MSLLSICQTVADSVGLPRPDAVASSTNQLARQMFAIANEVLEELCVKNWPILEIDYSFPMVNGTSQYALPADWKRNVADTMYNASQYYGMRGSMSPSDWQRQRNSLPSLLGMYRMRVYGNPLKINITPTPQVTDTVVFEYVTTNMAKDVAGVAKTQYAVDTDTSIVPEELVRMGLKWRIKHAKGLDYNEDYNIYQERVAVLFGQALDTGSIPVGYRSLYGTAELPDGYVRENGFG